METRLKTCTRCKKEKELKEFNRDSSQRDGFRIYCKQCTLKFQREYRNPYKVSKYQKFFKKHDTTLAYRKVKKENTLPTKQDLITIWNELDTFEINLTKKGRLTNKQKTCIEKLQAAKILVDCFINEVTINN